MQCQSPRALLCIFILLLLFFIFLLIFFSGHWHHDSFLCADWLEHLLPHTLLWPFPLCCWWVFAINFFFFFFFFFLREKPSFFFLLLKVLWIIKKFIANLRCNLRQAPIVYRLVRAAHGIFFSIVPFYFKIEILAKLAKLCALGIAGLNKFILCN